MGQVGKAKLLARARRLKGQVEAVERALEADVGTPEVLLLLASVRGAATSLTAELVERHIVHGMAGSSSDEDRLKLATELAGIVRTYLK